MPGENSIILSDGSYQDIWVWSEETLAVDHVDFDFYEGEVVSIVGNR